MAGAAEVRLQLSDQRSWNPVTEHFGALAPIYGTIVTSLIAMLIAVPVGLFIAMFLTELCPMWLRRPIGIAIELLAGIPSIIYGIWGLFVFAPVPAAACAAVPDRRPSATMPVLSTVVRRPALRHRRSYRRSHSGDHGAAFHHLDLARRVRCRAAGAQGGRLRPRLHHLGSRALRRAALHPRRRHRRRHARPWAARSARPWRSPSSSATRTASPGSILAPGTTISATIANEFTEAVGDIYTSSLIALGLILFVITFIVLAFARLMLMRLERPAGVLTCQ